MTSQPQSGRSSFNHITGYTMSTPHTPRGSYDPNSSHGGSSKGGATGRDRSLLAHERARPEASRSEPGFEVDEDGGASRGSPSPSSGSVTRRSPERGASLGSLEHGPGNFNGGGSGATGPVPRTRIATSNGLVPGGRTSAPTPTLTRIVSGRTVEMPVIVGSVQELQAWSEAQPDREPPEQQATLMMTPVLPDGSSDGGVEDGSTRGGDNSRDINYYPVGSNGFGSMVDLARKQSGANTDLPLLSPGSSGSYAAQYLSESGGGVFQQRPLLLAFASRHDTAQQQTAARAAAAAAADPNASGGMRVSATGGQYDRSSISTGLYDRSTNASVGGVAWQDIEAVPFKDPVSGKEVSMGTAGICAATCDRCVADPL